MVLVTGHRGQLGRAVVAAVGKSNPVIFPDLDITNGDAVKACLDGGIKYIINCAAFTNVDAAETDVRNWEVNAYAPTMLAELAAIRGIGLMHISSDYVYGGSTAPTIIHSFPINAYGKAKSLGDLGVYEADSHNFTIIRVQNLCSEFKGLVKGFHISSRRGETKEGHSLRTLELNPSVKVGPTSVYFLAEAIVLMMYKAGVYNYAPQTSVSIVDLFKYVAGPDAKFVESSDDKRPAKRKLDNTMIPSSIFEDIGHVYSWKQHVDDVIKRIAKGEQ